MALIHDEYGYYVVEERNITRVLTREFMRIRPRLVQKDLRRLLSKYIRIALIDLVDRTTTIEEFNEQFILDNADNSWGVEDLFIITLFLVFMI
jgi:hypothetical protein